MINGITNYNSNYNFYNMYNNQNEKNNNIDKSNSVDTQCETCNNRRYQDSSDENVSFKAPGYISPESSASQVISHENEHVSNAFDKAQKGKGKVLSVSVSLQTAICPECGKSYVSGGTTRTQILYNEKNPYQKSKKILEENAAKGSNINYAA